MSMVLFLALLLITLDLGTCQRKISRNVAVGADVKTVVNFDCPEEFGYYPHPSDCTQYYVCVFGGALLESCTGGLMYSHELQTCDWPRNVGCDGVELSSSSSSPTAPSSSSSSTRTREEPRIRYTISTPIPPQPQAVVTSRGQPRQLVHNPELIKQRQQQQLYAEAEETLPPAEEIENDRQQRVYRGQPSTVGQVQRDRDGLRQNAIPSYSGRNEKIGVISFGTQQQFRETTDELTDMTLKRTRRQIQRSIWRVGGSKPSPLNFPPPPLSFNNNYQNYASTPFKPFIPQHKTFVPSRLSLNRHNQYIQNTYYNPPTNNPTNTNFQIREVSTYKPIIIGTTQAKTNKFTDFDNSKQVVEYYKIENIMQPSQIITKNSSMYPENSTQTYLDDYKKSEPLDLESDYFGPPPSYYNPKNKYEDIQNPFAKPDFDFDKFLDKLRDNRFDHSTNSPQITGNSNLKQYNFYDHHHKITEKPRNIYSSQIKPNYTSTTPEIEYEYYDYDYPNLETTSKRGLTVLKNEVKYSSKYQEKPQLINREKNSNNVEISTTKSTFPQISPSVKPYKVTISIIPTLPDITASTTIKAIVTSPLLTSVTTYSTTLKPISESNRGKKATRPTTRPPRGKNRQRLTTVRTDDDKRPRVEPSTATSTQQAPISTATATARTIYNNSQYNNGNNYDPYYALYEDDVELYRDVDYPQQYNNQNQASQSYRRTASPIIQSTTVQEEQKRGNNPYLQNSYKSQDIYQPSTVSEYNEDNNYNTQVDDENSYRQINRQPTRKDRNDLNFIEEATKRIVTTRTTSIRTTTTSTTPRPIPPKRLPVTSSENKTQAQSIINLQEDPGPNSEFPPNILSTSPHSVTYGQDLTSHLEPDFAPSIAAVVNKPAPFSLPKHLSTEKTLNFHYITKPSSKSTHLVSMELPKLLINQTVIIPTTYSPPKFFLKSLFLKPSTELPKFNTKPYKTLKTVRKTITPLGINFGLSSAIETNFESAEQITNENNSKAQHYQTSSQTDKSIEIPLTTHQYSSTTIQNRVLEIPTTSTRNSTPVPPIHPINSTTIKLENLRTIEVTTFRADLEAKIRHYLEFLRVNNNNDTQLRYRNTVEVPPPQDLLEVGQRVKDEPDQYPEYKPKPFRKPTATQTKTDNTQKTSIPPRTSRVNTAIKSLIAFGGARRPNLKCHENQNVNTQCNDQTQRVTSPRGRGSAHYSNNIVSNEVTVNVNRGTPASRSRPTLKPSTSIVSKASEYIDIYRYPPLRPDPIYPQPQPDKTAAKCRKDVCLLPDCSCGGKEIPGDLSVEQVPQIVLLTFDDSVNDLNKGLYSDLFEKGRANPNGCPIAATFYVSHEWTDYSQVQNLYSDGHEIASHTVSHSFGEQFSQKKWTREVAGQREILSAYGGVKLEDVRGMRAPFLSVGGNKMFKMLYDSNFTYDSSMPIYENKPPSWPYTLDYKLFHDCMIPPCPTRSYPGVWEVPMVMWQDLNGGRCSMGDACSNPPDAEGVFKMLTKNFQRHYTTNRAPFGLFYHAAWFTQPHHKEGFINFLDSILEMKDVWLVTNWQAIQWIRDPTPISRLSSFQPFQCDYSDRPRRCNNPKVCNLWHKSGVRYMRTCQPCPDIYPWTGNTGIRSSRIDNDIED